MENQNHDCLHCNRVATIERDILRLIRHQHRLNIDHTRAHWARRQAHRHVLSQLSRNHPSYGSLRREWRHLVDSHNVCQRLREARLSHRHAVEENQDDNEDEVEEENNEDGDGDEDEDSDEDEDEYEVEEDDDDGEEDGDEDEDEDADENEDEDEDADADEDEDEDGEPSRTFFGLKPSTSVNLTGLKYVSNVNDNLVCGICYDPFVDPTMLRGCDHIFCLDCLKHWRAASNGSETPCPTCRQVVTGASRAPPLIRAMVDELVVHCPYHEQRCAQTMPRDQVEAHIDE